MLCCFHSRFQADNRDSAAHFIVDCASGASGVIMPSVGLGSSGGCHPDVDGTEDKCGNYNASLGAMKLGYRAFHDALSYVMLLQLCVNLRTLSERRDQE